MKKIAVLLITLFVISGCHNNTTSSGNDTITGNDKILKIMRDDYITRIEKTGLDFETPEDREKELDILNKMKKDFSYVIDDPNIVLTIPGPGWEIKGPLSLNEIKIQYAINGINDFKGITKRETIFITSNQTHLAGSGLAARKDM